MLLARGKEPVQTERVLADMRMNEQGHFGVELAERRVSREGNLHQVADAAHVYEHLIWSFVG